MFYAHQVTIILLVAIILTTFDLYVIRIDLDVMRTTVT